MRVPLDASRSVQEAFRELWNEVDNLRTRDIDMKGRRVVNASSELGSDLVTRRGLRAYTRSEDLPEDLSRSQTVIIGGGGGVSLSDNAPADLADSASAGTSLQAARSGHAHKLAVRVAKAGATIGTRRRINFAEGNGISIAATDDSADDEIDLTITSLVSTLNGSTLSITHASELLTLTGDTTDTSANLLPANAIILGVTGRVTTTVTRATTNPTAIDIGDPTTAQRFFNATGVTLSAGTTAIGLNHMKGSVSTEAAGPTQAAAAKVRVTINGSGAVTAGAIRMTAFYAVFVAPTS